MIGVQIVTLIGFILFVIYNIWILILNKGRIPESLSETSYILQNNYNKNYSYFFTIACVVLTFTLLPCWLEYNNETYQFLIMLSCSGLMFAGATPFFREDLEKPIHYTSAIISGVSCCLWFILTKNYEFLYFMLFGTIASMILVRSFKPWLYFAEVYGVACLVAFLCY